MKEKLRDTFLDLIAIDEVYPHEREIVEHIRGHLRRKDLTVTRDSFGNVVARVPGQGEPLMVSTHMDIPEPNPNVRYAEEGDVIRSTGHSILGADPKAGLAVLLEFLLTMERQDPTRHRPIEAVMTRGEEVGLVGASNFDFSLVSAREAIVLDEDGPVTQVVTKSPNQMRIDVEIYGKEAHSRTPEEGINALEMLHSALAELPWGYIAEGVTWNIGILKVGTALNTIPGRAFLQGEMRGYDQRRLREEARNVEETFRVTAGKFGAETEITREEMYEGYTLPLEHPFMQRLQRGYDALGLEPNYITTFGATDANIFNKEGIVTVPMGCGYHNAHQYTEYVDLGEMEQTYQFLCQLVREDAGN